MKRSQSESLTRNNDLTIINDQNTLESFYEVGEYIYQTTFNPDSTPLTIVEENISKMISSIINSKTSDGYTALHFAAEKNHVDLAEALLLQGADVTAKTNQGATPRDIAIARNHKDITKLFQRSFAIKFILNSPTDCEHLSSPSKSPANPLCTPQTQGPSNIKRQRH
jgi:ankyrin repeat protein